MKNMAMIDEIRVRMKEHVQSILEKPRLTDQEYFLIMGYLDRIQGEIASEKNEQARQESNEKLRMLMDSIVGGV